MPTSQRSNETPEALSASEEARRRAYCRWKLWLDLTEALLLLGVLSALTLTGTARGWLAWVHGLPVHPALGLLVYLVILGGYVRLAQLPVQFASEQWVEKRFGLARRGAFHWLAEWTRRSVLVGALGMTFLYPVALTLPWWPFMLLPWAALLAFLRWLYLDLLYHTLLSVFYPVRRLREETFTLPGIGRTTLPVYEVKVSDRTARVGASILLRGKRSIIYVTDTLIQEFDDGEERVVMAHEFGHLWDRMHLEARTHAGVRQAARKAALGLAQLGSGAAACVFLELAAPRLELNGAADPTGLPLLAALALGLSRVWTPLTCAEARRDETEADQFALSATGDRESYLSVLAKLRRINLDEAGADPLSRLLFDTHPSYEERAMLVEPGLQVEG